MSAREVNFDGLIGPSHNYAGLAPGNLASARHAGQISRPRDAALQGLEKMRTLLRLGYAQGFLPPQQRPWLNTLRQLGFRGDDGALIEAAARQAPQLLPLVYSASSMWAANAATVTPSADSRDGRVHFTPANLLTAAHRSLEPPQTCRALQRIFADPKHFQVHEPLPSHTDFGDEGAANHSRLCRNYGSPGRGLFVYGRSGNATTQRFPARQTRAASEAVARQHGVLDSAVLLQQHPAAIDAGAFHNDVVAVANGPLLFHHQDAFDPASQAAALGRIGDALPLQRIEVPRSAINLDTTIRSYLFNSQLLAAPDGDMSRMRLVAPTECRDEPSVSTYLRALLEDRTQPIRELCYVDVRQSMSNGGGPACLRLRVVLTEAELAAVHPAFLLDEDKIDALCAWVNTHYRNTLNADDLADPRFMDECLRALDALTALLGLAAFYPFQ